MPSPKKSEKELMEIAAEYQTPRAVKKRLAPSPTDLTRKDAGKKEERWGVNLVVRVKPSTRDALDKARRTYNVEKGSFTDFLLRAALFQLATGRIRLPEEVEEKEGKPKKLKLPELPEQFL